MISDGEIVQANGIELCYRTLGDPANPTLLLIMGTGGQLNSWEPSFLAQFVDQGFHVVVYDHRDTGRSTWFGDLMPDMPLARTGDPRGAIYSLADMADDASALLTALGIERAHVAGASLGGMVAQTLAIRHPEQVISLASIMSTTGDKSVGQYSPEAFAAVTSSPAAPATNRAEAVEAALRTSRVVAGTDFPFDEERLRRRAERLYDRGYNPRGVVRHQAAAVSAPDRTPALRELRIPTVVIHGTADPLVGVTGGEATAAAIPGATIVLIPGMGHEFPVEAQPTVVAAVAANAHAADQARGESTNPS